MADDGSLIEYERELDGREFSFAISSKLRHGELWKLVRKFGTQAALAKHLGIEVNVMCRLVNMKGRPPVTAKWWPGVMDKLLVLTGKTPGELFPEWLRSDDFLALPKEHDEIRRLPVSAIKGIAQRNESACLEQLPNAIREALKSLSFREREIVKLRFGLGDGRAYTLEEVSHIFKVTRGRIKQIEAKAVRKLSQPGRMEAILAAASEDGIDGYIEP